MLSLAPPHPPGLRPLANASNAIQALLRVGAYLGILTHIAFITLFWLTNVTPMALANVASILTYLLALRLIHSDRYVAALNLMAVEICAHAVAGVIVVGWDSGFHFYLLMTIPVVLANPRSRWAVKIGMALVISTVYLGLGWASRHASPVAPMDATTLLQLHEFNLLGTIFVLSSLTVVYVRLIDSAEARLHELATTDALTGLMNRRSILEAIAREQALRQRKPHHLSLILVDIDHFKKINDTHGHATGDTALKAVAGILRKCMREMDYVARWGGEEFLVVQPHADKAQSQLAAERLRAAVEAESLPGDGQPIRLTITLGLTELGTEEQMDQGLQRADAALYEGKHQGRNRVVPA
jgi:diguanylate cyclase (GGDEF)-like protein